MGSIIRLRYFGNLLMRNISSLHFSHFERKPGLEYNRNICEGYVRPIFTCQSRDKLKSSTGAKCPIPQGILWCRFQYHETTRSISTSSWKGCKAIIGLSPPPCLQHEARRYPNQHSRIGWSLILNMKSCWLMITCGYSAMWRHYLTKMTSRALE